MCMAPTHHLGGAWAGALYGWHVGLPLWACAWTAAAATVTAGGILSPDMDQFKGWKRINRWTPDEALGWGGPLKHRGITHWPGLPVIAAYLVHGWETASMPLWWAPLAVPLAWALIIGWTSHLALDFVWGKAWGNRGKGVPLFGWTGYVGVGLDAGGVTEWIFRILMLLAPFGVAYMAATP